MLMFYLLCIPKPTATNRPSRMAPNIDRATISIREFQLKFLNIALKAEVA